MEALNETANNILDVAENYTQTRGFNAFSYKDIQKVVGIKTSSIHYYFPTKQDLAISMAMRYVERFLAALEEIEQEHANSAQRLNALGGIYIRAAKEGKFCLCGMLASDILALPKEANAALDQFFSLVEKWIEAVIDTGKASQEFKNSVDSKRAAAHFLATLEGGMLIDRTRKPSGYLKAVISEALDQLTL